MRTSMTKDKKILARKPYSAHEGDEHLEIVLAELPHNTVTPFVTWGFNKQNNGYFWGHYFSSKQKALDDFNAR